MSGWNDLLARLAELPRENGSAALNETARFLADTLQRSGIGVHLVPFAADPYRLRLAGLVIFAGTLLYLVCMRRRAPLAALAVAVLVPLLLVLELDFFVPVFGWMGGRAEQYHVEARIPGAHPVQHLILSAHYDTKTDAFDHLLRAPVDYLGIPVALLMIGAAVLAWRARKRAAPTPRLASAAPAAAVVYGVASLGVFSGGALAGARSPGALDDGAACAVLVRVAQALSAAPPLRTSVEILLLSGEEIGVQGSWAFAASRFATPPAQPLAAINLEFIGVSGDLAAFRREVFATRAYRPDAGLLSALDEVHRKRRGKPLHLTWYGAATDARSFLAHGVKAVTLSSDLPGHAIPRGLHSTADVRSRIDVAALDATVDYLLDVVRLLDERRL